MRGKFLCGLMVLLCLTSGLWGGGWNNTLMGIRAIALGGAFAGLADDPSAIFYNPAGLTRQSDRFNMAINGFYITPIHTYSTETGIRAESRNKSSLPQIFISYKYSDRVTLGFGAYVPYAGGGMDWEADELGFPLKSTLGVMALTPCISYKLSEQFSLGFSLHFYRGIHELNTIMPGLGPVEAEESGTAVSAGLGLMFLPSERFRIGLSIRGPAKMKMEGKTSILYNAPGLGNVNLDLESETSFNLPWDIEIGTSYVISDRLLITASAQYTMWSTLDTVDKTIKNIPIMGNMDIQEALNFNNILILRTGFEYALPGGIFIRGGIGMDRYASPEESLSLANIDVDKLTLIGGIGYQTGDLRFDVVYVHAQGKEREKVSTPIGFPVSERFNLDARILGMGITFSF